MPEIWSASLMLDWLGHREPAAAVLRAIEAVLEAGPKNAPLTRDIGGTASTVDLGRAIAESVAAR
jgi:tartrate dehydrogenase/decarboxylase/D-malate dehydrogenase